MCLQDKSRLQPRLRHLLLLVEEENPLLIEAEDLLLAEEEDLLPAQEEDLLFVQEEGAEKLLSFFSRPRGVGVVTRPLAPRSLRGASG